MPTLPEIIILPSATAVVTYELPIALPPETANFDAGTVVPMPTLPFIIIPSVGAAICEYAVSFPTVIPPFTLNFDPGAVSPMPTLPFINATLSSPPPAVEYTPIISCAVVSLLATDNENG